MVAPSFFRKLGYFLVFTYKKRDGDGLAWNVQRNIMRHSLQLAKKRFQSHAAQQFFGTAVLDAAGKKVTWFHKIMYEMRDELFARAVDRNVSLSPLAPQVEGTLRPFLRQILAAHLMYFGDVIDCTGLDSIYVKKQRGRRGLL